MQSFVESLIPVIDKEDLIIRLYAISWARSSVDIVFDYQVGEMVQRTIKEKIR